MEHLTPDTLARLVDEAPVAAERGHLGACAHCRDEWDALREQTSLLGGLGRIGPPPGSWQAVQQRLLDEGLLRPPATRWRSTAVRAAAAVLVVVGASALTWRAVGGSDAASPVRRLAAVEARPPTARATQRVAPTPAPPVRSTVDVGSVATEPETATTRRFAAAQPVGATRRVALPAVPDDDANALEQLAAWEGIVLATGDALERAPADPVANGLHFAALRQRDAALRTLALTSREPWF